ncbi:MAG: 4-hydroxy-tetrahydrodipicolinate synthase [Gracilimonas sp.]|uniref:4-hydroxy-tetrahydrodipicolinate synthase n=1 Tax=Gracilimonas sp. TaxID=1974203 RepID=UPI00199A83E8|nr:4-hydroxy-tetrahydrodipicolinate synthase [Gracilimonas sp.]MBD3615310.1 4-hydroxy-tetrahydrodipicolinate synthase [Gracilimonas sp.]
MEKFPLWTAIVTPMNANGSVDYDSFEYILRKQEEAGNGVLVLGSTGEGLNLNEEEKREIVEFTKGLNLDVPMMVGIGGFNLPAQADFIHFCNEIQPDVLLLVTPLYAKPGAEGQFEWFSELMAETDIPCMLYNVPSRTGVKMHPSVPARLKQEFDHLFGVKEASGSVEEFKAFRREAPDVKFYSGDDGLTPAFAKEGAVGLVSVASNVWPKATHRYTEMCIEGNSDNLFPLWKNATDVLFKAPNPVPAKVLLNRKDWITNDTVRLPLSLGDISDKVEQELLKADKEISNWLEDQQ